MAGDRYPKWDYKEYPKTLPADDLWGQVRRTVYGKPVPEEQIQFIVDAIVAGLQLHPYDVVLDIGCGNGALTSRLFTHCDRVVGVDASPYLISVANERFAAPSHTFICANACEYVRAEAHPDRFTKAVCYATISYLDDADARTLLGALRARFVNISALFIGGIPDPTCAATFFAAQSPESRDLANPQSQIGVWRSRNGMKSLATATGWTPRFRRMRADFYQAHYRYNAVFEPFTNRGDAFN